MQNFPGGRGADLQGGYANLLLGQIFPENYMKLKEIGPSGERGVRPWRPPPQIRHWKIVKNFQYRALHLKINIHQKKR